MKHSVDFHYFPGFVRKSLTFSLDDGNVRWDKETAELMRSVGIRGTYNLCSSNLSAFDAEGYRAFYDGFEIANHVHGHPFAVTDEHRDYPIVDEPFDVQTAAEQTFYKTDEEGVYHLRRGERVFLYATREAYLRLTERSRLALEQIFGEGSVAGFVWPYGEQRDETLRAELGEHYAYIRKTGCVLNTTGYAFPADRMAWSYNADHKHLLSSMADYADAPDDGELKFFCYGVHSIDFERDGLWGDLREFCRLYGNRPDLFYSAPVIELFRYADAVAALRVTDEGIENPSDEELYGTVDGERVVLSARSTYRFDE